MTSSNFVFSFGKLCVIISFFFDWTTKLGVLFSTAVKAVVVAKLVIIGISPLTWFFLGLRAAGVAKLVILGIFPLISFILALREALVAKLVISGIYLQ